MNQYQFSCYFKIEERKKNNDDIKEHRLHFAVVNLNAIPHVALSHSHNSIIIMKRNFCLIICFCGLFFFIDFLFCFLLLIFMYSFSLSPVYRRLNVDIKIIISFELNFALNFPFFSFHFFFLYFISKENFRRWNENNITWLNTQHRAHTNTCRW